MQAALRVHGWFLLCSVYRERILLPGGAEFQATPEDVSRADVPAEVKCLLPRVSGHGGCKRWWGAIREWRIAGQRLDLLDEERGLVEREPRDLY